MTQSYFVTATGTDLGKTYVLCRILEQLREREHPVAAVKPVLSGYDPSQASESDAGRILRALGEPCGADDVARISPWRFNEPLSPDMAAAREGQRVGLDDVASFCRRMQARSPGLMFVEGAGGILSPLGHDFTNLDLALALSSNSLLIAGGYLGTISHTLSAVAAMSARDGKPSCVILSGAQGGPVSLVETAETIKRFCDVPIHIVERDGRVPDALIDQLRVTA
jgi:dethiobiotin synthetase